MKRWFESLPIHRKLTVLALGVSAAALTAAMVGLAVFDIVRFRASAIDDARGLAQVIAQNIAAAIVFDDEDDARQMLASVRVRPVVLAACVYRLDGTLLAGYQQSAAAKCPDRPAAHYGWQSVGSEGVVTRNGREVGTVYVERALSDMGARVAATAAAGGLMLLMAGGMALALAHRLQRIISRPIVALAQAARTVGGEQPYAFQPIAAPPDETGELVRAFGEMIRRVGDANAALISSNEALRTEVDQRRQMQAEREGLLRREQEASRLKDEFLAAVSHELRTPLNAILGWTQILSATAPSPQTLTKAIASLSRNAHAQHRVIEDLLDVSRIITGKLQLKLAAVDLRAVLDSALEVITPGATAKNIRLDVDTLAAACIVQGDADRLQQVIWNLLSNAVKFTPAGGAVSVRLRRESGGYAIAVTDSGVGISTTFLPHVFDRFRQADGSFTREHGGLGLGLAIAKELTDLHGGSVRASSDGPGLGATFTVTLPNAGNPAARQPADDEREGAPLPRLDGIHVLAVDDNPDALDIASSALSHAGATVRTAANGSDAVSQWTQAPSDVLLCDLAMPQMDGFAVLDRIRRLDADGGRVTTAIAVTAHASAEYRAHCLRAGFQGHIAKPYNTMDLVRAVAAAMHSL